MELVHIFAVLALITTICNIVLIFILWKISNKKLLKHLVKNVFKEKEYEKKVVEPETLQLVDKNRI